MAQPTYGAAPTPMVTSYPAISQTTTDPTSSTSFKKKTKDVLEAEQGLAEAVGQSNQATQAQLDAAQAFAEREKQLNIAAADAAHADAAEIQWAEDERKRLEQERLQRHSELLQQEAEQQKRVEAASGGKGYFESMSTPQRVIAAIALGMGASQNDTSAMDIFRQYAGEHRERQAAALRKEAQKLEAMGKTREQVLGMMKEREAQLDREHIANLKLLGKQAEATAKLIPGASERATQFLTEANKEIAETSVKNQQAVLSQADQFAPTTTSTSGTRSLTINDDPSKAGAGQNVTADEAKQIKYGRAILRSVDTIENAPKLNDKEVGKLSDNVRAIMNQAENSTKGLSGEAKIRAMQAFNLAPESFTDGIPKDKKMAANAWLEATGLIIRDQSGAAILSWEDMRNWQLKGPQKGEGQAVWNQKLKQIKEDGDYMVSLGGKNAQNRVDAGMAKPAPAQEQKPAVPEALRRPKEMPAEPTKPRAPVSEKEVLAKALRVQPGDPDYAKARKVVEIIRQKMQERIRK